MRNLEAVDAKVERAHDQLRLLRDEAAHFCREWSRLIMPEQCGDRQVWVYRTVRRRFPSGGPCGWANSPATCTRSGRARLDRIAGSTTAVNDWRSDCWRNANAPHSRSMVWTD